MMEWYVLNDDHEIIPATEEEWIAFHSSERKVIAKNYFGDVLVSTVFLGRDPDLNESGHPILFETMILDAENDWYQKRCTTYAEALAMHEEALALVKSPRQE